MFKWSNGFLYLIFAGDSTTQSPLTYFCKFSQSVFFWMIWQEVFSMFCNFFVLFQSIILKVKYVDLPMIGKVLSLVLVSFSICLFV